MSSPIDGTFEELTTDRAGRSNLPFPWQIALFESFCAGTVPSALTIPTGLGKTAVIPLWLLARAHGAPLPTRLVYVVDRRAVVDQSTEYALLLRDNLEGRCNALKPKLGLTGPLRISTLRGQFADNRAWLANPVSPAIIVGTVDMIGSRLLFEGYGVSRGMRPMEAGLLGHDTLVVLDEAHLSQPFAHLVRAVGEKTGEGGPRLMTLSATQATAGSTFSLTAKDHAHPVVTKRVGARKRLIIEDRPDAKPDDVAEAAWALAEAHPNTRIAVFVDTFDMATKVKDTLAKLVKKAWKRTDAVGMLTGNRRGLERDKLAEWLAETGFVAGTEDPLAQTVFLVATSAGEVGIDLDAQHMLCDLVTWDRMVQRLGRVNRRGDGVATVRVLDLGPNTCPDDEAQRRALARTLLQALPGDVKRDASPAALEAVAKAHDVTEACRPAPLYPPLETADVQAWSMTSLREHAGRPEVGPWLRGWVEDEPQTSLLWRRHLPVMVVNGEAQSDPATVARYGEYAPPRPSERLETATYRALDWLKKRAAAFAKARAVPHADLPDRHAVALLVLHSDGDLRKSLTFDDLENASKRDWDQINRLLPGTTLILAAALGGLDTHGLLDPKVADPPATSDETWNRERLSPFEDVSVAFESLVPRGDGLQPRQEPDTRPLARFVTRITADGNEVEGFAIYRTGAADPDAAEAKSVRRTAQTLAAHTAQVVAKVRDFAVSLDLSEDERTALIVAAELHDTGKAAAVWQAAAGVVGAEVMAKTDGKGADWLRLQGYRHEFGSLISARERTDLASETRDLILHLIAAHHGHARPLIPFVGCEEIAPSNARNIAGEAALRFAELTERYGPWRLAWLEAILRAADQQASREAEESRHG